MASTLVYARAKRAFSVGEGSGLFDRFGAFAALGAVACRTSGREG